MARGSDSVLPRVLDGQAEWAKAGKLLGARDPKTFARLLALACAAASTCEDELEDAAVFRSRMIECNVPRTKTQ